MKNMNEINKFEIIKREELDERNYFGSLIDIGFEKGLLNIKDIENLQLQSIALLKNRVKKYNGFDSSSIPKDNAKVIIESNVYNISIYLKKFKPDGAIDELKKMNLQEIYNQGRKLIDEKINISKNLFNKVINNKISTKNETYNATIIDGIDAFFKIYDPDFEANEIKITADYPLYNNIIGKLDGIEFIEEYLKSIYYENEFCRKFSNTNIEHLLYCYCEIYEDLIINIFEIVLTATIGCSIANENIMNLTISNIGLEHVYSILLDTSKEYIYEIVFKSYLEIKYKLFNENVELQDYIEKNLDQIQYLVYNAVKNKTLDKLFIIDDYK